jgi:hypothetical protein
VCKAVKNFGRLIKNGHQSITDQQRGMLFHNFTYLIGVYLWTYVFFTVEFQSYIYIHLINLRLGTQCSKYTYLLTSSTVFGFTKPLHSRSTPWCATIPLPLQRKAHFRPYIRKQNQLYIKTTCSKTLCVAQKRWGLTKVNGL